MKSLHQTSKQIQQELKVIELAKRDTRAFSALYERYYKPVFLYIFKRVDGIGTANNLSSQVFLKAIVNLPKYKFKGVPFSGWLFRIASNEVNLHYRKNQTQRTISLEDAGIYRLADDMTSNKNIDTTALIVHCINTLSPVDVEIIELRYFEKRSFKEVAYILGIKENNAKVKVHRIIEKLKKAGEGMLKDD